MRSNAHFSFSVSLEGGLFMCTKNIGVTQFFKPEEILENEVCHIPIDGFQLCTT